MELEEAIDQLELFKDDLNELEANEDFILQDGMKFDTAEALQRVLHHIKEDESVIEEMGQSIYMLPNEFKSAEEVIEVFRKKVRNG